MTAALPKPTLGHERLSLNPLYFMVSKLCNQHEKQNWNVFCVVLHARNSVSFSLFNHSYNKGINSLKNSVTTFSYDSKAYFLNKAYSKLNFSRRSRTCLPSTECKLLSSWCFEYSLSQISSFKKNLRS